MPGECLSDGVLRAGKRQAWTPIKGFKGFKGFECF